MTVNASVKIINNQIAAILNQMTDEQYRLSLDIFNGSTVGQHIRHIFDFYNCIINTGHQETAIDYACRERNPLVETERLTALSSMAQIVNEVEDIDFNKSIHVVTDFSTDKNEPRPSVLSSIGRELMYAYDHAVHHLAIIKMGITSSFPSITLDREVGVAPSTIKYQSKN